MIKRLLLVFFLSMFALGSQAASPVSGEYIILVGGPSMYQWEKYKTYPHDHWWANFFLAERLRHGQFHNGPLPHLNVSFLSVDHRCINGKSTRLIRTIIGGRTLFGLRVYAPNNYEPSSARMQ